MESLCPNLVRPESEVQVKLGDLDDPKAFHQFMLDVNARLQQDGVSIASRPFRAWVVLKEQTDAQMTWFGGTVADRITAWYAKQYGVRAGIGVWHRRMLAMLGGDPWVLNIPMVYGTVRVDLMRMIEHALPALMNRIAEAELRIMDSLLPHAMDALNALNHTEPDLYADWLGSVDYATGGFPNFGMSRWASQQAFEKILKEFITRKGGRRERTHDLQALASTAEQLGLPPVDRALLAKAECPPGARYPGSPESTASTAAMAVDAHQASIILSGRVVAEWQTTPHWRIEGYKPMAPCA